MTHPPVGAGLGTGPGRTGRTGRITSASAPRVQVRRQPDSGGGTLGRSRGGDGSRSVRRDQKSHAAIASAVLLPRGRVICW